MERGQILLAILFLLSVISCFLPWFRVKITTWSWFAEDDKEWTDEYTNYGYDYIIPLGAPYTAPVAILNVIGFILLAYSFRAKERIRKLSVRAGILILVGVIATFVLSFFAAFNQPIFYDVSISILLVPEYGIGLEALFGFLMIIAGRRCLKKLS